MLIWHQTNWVTRFCLTPTIIIIIIINREWEHITRSGCTMLPLSEWIHLVCTYIYSHRTRERERRKRVNRMHICIYCLAVGDTLSHHTYTFFFVCWLFTAQLNTINDRLFDVDLYIGENEKTMKSIRHRKMRQQVWWWSLYKACVNTNLN